MMEQEDPSINGIMWIFSEGVSHRYGYVYYSLKRDTQTTKFLN